jgi:hypothetical protein
MHIVVTLAERDYLYGAAALYNSLVLNSFEGLFIVGYRNRLAIPAAPIRALELASNRVRLIELSTSIHFTNYKPQFMQEILDLYPECSSITYIDPDIVVDAPFSWIVGWCEGGPAACADVNWCMPVEHPIRRQWLQQTGLRAHHNLSLYFNGGFLSVLRSDSRFLSLWQQLIKINEDPNTPLDVKGEIFEWRKAGRSDPFMAIDQDALNIALMAWEGPITTLGPDAMGFANGSTFLAHALGTPKPWQKHYIKESLSGFPPGHAHKLFWSYVNTHLKVISDIKVFRKKLSIRLASLIGRFYRRS